MEAIQTTAQRGRFKFSYTGTGTGLAIVMLKNLFLTLITLGIYRAWAKTNFRRFLWENVTFMGDRGTYVGTGRELFRGWMKLAMLIIVYSVVSRAIIVLVPLLAFPLSIFTVAVYMVVFALATYSGLRYRMSRTLWRQVRFGVDKDEASTMAFLKLYLTGVFLSVITLGFYYPIFKNRVRSYLVNRTRLGTANFKYDGEDGEFFRLSCVGMLLTIITFGLYGPWYLANVLRFKLKHTSFQGARFEFTMSGKDIFVCGLLAYLGAIFTVGLAVPWIFSWGLGKITENIYLVGDVDLALIKNKASDGSAMADDIVASYDLDLGF